MMAVNEYYIIIGHSKEGALTSVCTKSYLNSRTLGSLRKYNVSSPAVMERHLTCST